MDEYIKRKRVLSAAKDEPSGDTKARIVEAVKLEFKGIGENIKELLNKFNVLEQIIKKVGSIEEEHKHSGILAETSSEQPQGTNSLFDWQTPEANTVLQENSELGLTERMADERIAVSTRVKEDDSVVKKLQESSQIAERTKKIRKRP